MQPDLTSLTISLALEQLKDQAYTPLDLVEACFRRIQFLNPLLNAFIAPTLELAVQQSMRVMGMQTDPTAVLDELLLPGIPLGIKDLFDVRTVPTTAGSKFFSDRLPGEHARAVHKLEHSGAVILGKTNTHEIALGVTGVNPHFGAVKNPWDPSRISGGSSSGSAVAIASGMCLGALGTDTGGSIRIPASLCGVVGLKPTYGRVSTRGVVPLSWNLDHVGPLTHTVRDAALLMSVLAGYDPQDSASVDLPVPDYLSRIEEDIRDWHVVQAAGEYIEGSDSEVLASVDYAARGFRDLGAHVEEVDLSWLRELAQANGRMTQSDAAAFHRDRLAEHPDWFGADVLQRLRIGAAITSTDYALARRLQSESRRRFEQFFDRVDLLLLPTTPVSAPLIADTEALEAAGQLTRFTSPFNLTGLPAISLPCGFSSTGLPIGLQLVSNHWDEARLLRAAHAYENATEWHLRKPALLP